MSEQQQQQDIQRGLDMDHHLVDVPLNESNAVSQIPQPRNQDQQDRLSSLSSYSLLETDPWASDDDEDVRSSAIATAESLCFMDSDLVSEARSMSERDASRGRSNEDTTTLPQPSRVTSASVLARTSPTQRLSLRRRARTVSGKWRYERAQRAALGLARSLPDIRGNTMVSDDGIPLNVDSWTDTRSEGSIVETEVVVASLSSEEVPSSFFDKVTRFISRLLWSAPVELQTDRAEAEVSAQEEHIIGSDELTFEFMVDDEKDDEMLPPTPREWWWHAMLQYVKPMDVINLLLTTTSAFPSSSLSIVRLANLVLCAVAFVATWKWSDRCLRSNWAK